MPLCSGNSWKPFCPQNPRLPQLRRVGVGVDRGHQATHPLIEPTRRHIDVLRLNPQFAAPRFQRPTLGCRPERRTHPRTPERGFHTDVGNPNSVRADRWNIGGITGNGQQQANDTISEERLQPKPPFHPVPCRQQVEGILQSVVVLDPRRRLRGRRKGATREHGPLSYLESRRDAAFGRDLVGRATFDSNHRTGHCHSDEVRTTQGAFNIPPNRSPRLRAMVTSPCSPRSNGSLSVATPIVSIFTFLPRITVGGVASHV